VPAAAIATRHDSTVAGRMSSSAGHHRPVARSSAAYLPDDLRQRYGDDEGYELAAGHAAAQ
jgi:hypothetical protein